MNVANFPPVVIRASAGTGKTFQLSNRFIGLALCEPCDSILATTFTRKAAGEILGRVLLRLAEACLDAGKLAELARHVQEPTLDLPRSRDLLRGLVRQLHRLRVSTLDSFFIQVARSFSLELGLPPGWDIVDEMLDGRLRGEAIRAMLQEHTQDVIRLMHLLTKGEATRGVSEQIATLVAGLYSLYQEAPAAAWQAVPRHKMLAAAELEAALEALKAVCPGAGKRLVDAHAKNCQDALAGQWEAFLAKGLAAKVFDGSELYYGKPLAAELAAALRPLVKHAEAVLVARIADQTQATYDLLARFDAAYQRLKIEHRALRFEDVTQRLNSAAMDARLDEEKGDRHLLCIAPEGPFRQKVPVPFFRLDEIVYRLDAQVSHLLLDEFQDTSSPQWRVLRPFARHVLSAGAGHSFFCVGDVKQAIYGWRGGVAEIFEALDVETEFPSPLAGESGVRGKLQRQTLNQSFRSAPTVIACVNQVFAQLATNGVLGKYADAAASWAGRFLVHSTARTELRGYCRMVVAPAAGDGEAANTATLCYAAEEVARLHGQQPGATIGVLVRRNAAVARLIYELHERGVEASEEGGNPLTDSPAVELLLSLLKLADHPGDTAARFHVSRSPLAEAVQLTDHADTPAACRLAADIRRALVDEGYGPTLSRWVKQLAPVCSRRDVSRLEQLLELAYAYEDRATLRADDFVALVQQQRVQDPTAAAVRVMTVHQAKGLQFDVVVLPELDVLLNGQPPQIVADCPVPGGEVQRVCRYVSKELRPLLPAEFQRMFAAQEQRVVEEALCVLYVAMTRAVHALHVIIAPAREREQSVPSTFAGVLRAALGDGKPATPGSVLYECGEEHWHTPLPTTTGSPLKKGATDHAYMVPGLPGSAWPSAEKDTAGQASSGTLRGESQLTVRLAPSPERPVRGLEHRSPSQLEGGQRVDLARLLRPERAAALDRGSLMHAWFEAIEWLDEAEPDDATLLKLAAGPAFRTLDARALLAHFRAVLQRPDTRAALCRAAYQGPPATAAVWREHPFAVREGDVLLNGKIDRLVVLSDGDRVLAADVLDFKTDALGDDPQAIDARVEVYRPQLLAYRRAAARLLGVDVAQVSARLLFVEPGVVRAVDIP